MPFVMSCVTTHDDDIPTQNPRYTEHSPLGITEIAVLWISVFVRYYLIICHNLLIIPNLPTLEENLQCNYSSDYILCRTGYLNVKLVQSMVLIILQLWICPENVPCWITKNVHVQENGKELYQLVLCLFRSRNTAQLQTRRMLYMYAGVLLGSVYLYKNIYECIESTRVCCHI